MSLFSSLSAFHPHNTTAIRAAQDTQSVAAPVVVVATFKSLSPFRIRILSIARCELIMLHALNTIIVNVQLQVVVVVVVGERCTEYLSE